MPACPLTLSWVCGQPTTSKSGTVEGGEESGAGVREGGGDSVREGGCDGVRKGGGENTDYESIVLMKLRQAEERKRLCDDLAGADS